jgi:hypothetical protein
MRATAVADTVGAGVQPVRRTRASKSENQAVVRKVLDPNRIHAENISGDFWGAYNCWSGGVWREGKEIMSNQKVRRWSAAVGVAALALGIGEVFTGGAAQADYGFGGWTNCFSLDLS